MIRYKKLDDSMCGKYNSTRTFKNSDEKNNGDSLTANRIFRETYTGIDQYNVTNQAENFR